jgi:hypothetical protein
MIKQLLTVLISISSVSICSAQITTADTVALEKTAGAAINFYRNNITEQAEIYNGPEYRFLPRSAKGSPFFDEKIDFTNNGLKYNGNWYQNVPLLYDVYKGLLVSAHPRSNALFSFKEQAVSDFFVYGHHFVYIPAIDSAKNKLRAGYYEQLYTGKSNVLCKFEKIRIENVSAQGVEVTFFDKETFYIINGGTIHTVNSKGSVLDVFKDKKKELNNYLKTANIDYKEDKGVAIAKIAAYYDQISN